MRLPALQGGYNVALNPGDSVERHFMDTIEGGKWLRIRARLDAGVDGNRAGAGARERDRLLLRSQSGRHAAGKAFAGQTFDRTVHKGDLTGIEIINRLMEQVWARGPPARRQRAVALVPAKDGSLAGADDRCPYRRVSSSLHRPCCWRPAAATIPLPHAVRRGDMDGLAMALRLGLPLRDMEMVSSIRPGCSPAPTPA
jgi:fumarate reductase flavoprotein subunit